MNFQVKQFSGRAVAGFHMVGPWEKTVKQGFEQLALWIKTHDIPEGEWIAAYYDNPEETPAEKLRCNTVISVPEDFTIPPNSEGVILTHLPAGDYAVYRTTVEDGDFGQPWYEFFGELAASEQYQFDGGSCFEIYLNDGCESGVWKMDLYVSVVEKG